MVIHCTGRLAPPNLVNNYQTVIVTASTTHWVPKWQAIRRQARDKKRHNFMNGSLFVPTGSSYPMGLVGQGPGSPSLRGPNREFGQLKPHFGSISQFDMSDPGPNCALPDSLVQRTTPPTPETPPYGAPSVWRAQGPKHVKTALRTKARRHGRGCK